MSLTKRVQGNYTLKSVDPADQMFITTKTLTIDGDLVVIGDSTQVNSTDTAIADNTIVLNSGETGTGVSMVTSGIEIDRGTNINVGLRYNDSLDYWEATDDGTAYYPLDFNKHDINIIKDLTPQLGGDLDVNGFRITSASNGDVVLDANGTGLVKIDDVLSLQNQTVDPGATVGYNKVYAKAAGAGGTGLYVNNSEVTDELVSKRKAIIYSLVF